MAIKVKSQQPKEIEIDLTGPNGNAFFLLGQAQRWGKQMGLDTESLLEEMKSGDYENLIQVFDREFGSFCTLYR